MTEENIYKDGAAIDIRSEAEKQKDYKLEELVSAIDPVNWVQKPESSWRKFPIFNQDGSGSCVAQTEAKELGIIRWLIDGVYIHFSATDIYQRRFNKPQGGMHAVDARKIATQGTTLEILTPSQDMNDSQMDGTVIEPYKREVGAVFAVPNYVELPSRDIETVASTIQKTGKGVMVWFYFSYPEWTERPKIIDPNLPLVGPSTVRHSVTAVDFTLTPDGKKALIIEDSWGPYAGAGGQRVIDEDFYKARNWYASYITKFRFQEADPTPTPIITHTFNTDLEFGMRTDEVVILQDILKLEGCFPTNTQSTGYYGSVTKASVGKYQTKYGIAKTTSAGYGRLGPKTRAHVNAKYGQ